MLIQKPERIRDEKYRRDAEYRQCRAIDPDTLERCPNGAMLCHINIAGNFGMSLKAGDDEAIDLCQHHHDDFDDRRAATGEQRALWLLRNVYLPEEKLRYLKWKADREAEQFNRRMMLEGR